MTITTRRRFLAFGAAAAGVAAMPRMPFAAGCTRPPLGTSIFQIFRKGDVVGEHVLTLERDAGDLVVTNDIEIVVKFFGIPVYRYEHQNREVWRDGTLQAVSSKTNKNGKTFDLTGERRDGALYVEGREGELTIDGDILTTSLWHPGTREASELLDIEVGEVEQVRVSRTGTERVPGPDGQIEAEHYRIDGDLQRDVWYDRDCRLVRVAFDAGKDGSRITLEPKAIKG